MNAARSFVFFVICFGAVLWFSNGDAAYAQQPQLLEQDIDVTIDRVGNAEFTLKFTLPAEQWLNWKRTYGQNPSLLKRDLQHRFSTLVLRDLNLQSDDMNRNTTFHFRADAAAEYRGNSVWEVELERGVRSAKLAEDLWQFTKTSTEDGGILQQTYRVRIPSGTRNAAEATNELGLPVLRYEMARGAGGVPVLLVTAGVLLLAGLAVLAIAFTKSSARQ